MLASLFSLASLLALVSAQFCPQTIYGALSPSANLIPGAGKVRRPIDRATNQPGFDIVAWTHDGVTSILGTNAPATGPAELVGAGGTTISNAFSSNGAGGAFATLEDLEANGDEWIVVAAKVAVVDGTAALNTPLVEFGGAQKLTIRRNGEWFFGTTHGFIATGFSAANTDLVFTFRRFARDGEIRVSFINARARGTGIARVENDDGVVDLAASLFDISAGSVVWSGPPATASTTVDNLLVFYGRGNLAVDAAAITADFLTRGPTNAFDTCVFERWETEGAGSSSIGATCNVVGYAVPGCGNNNLKLTWKKTNFQSATALTGGNVNVAWNANPNFISNFSAVAGTGVTLTGFTGRSLSVPLTAGGGHGASQSITFTATVFACAAQALPRTAVTTDPVDAASPDQIFVGTTVAEIFLLRQSRLAFTVTDLRPFDLKDLPIAAGCGVPLDYAITVTNNGPSCVNQAAGALIDLTEVDTGVTSTVPTSLAPEDIETPVGGTYSVSPLGLWTLTADEDADNQLGLNRSLGLTRGSSQGLFSGNLSAPFYPFFRRTRVEDFGTTTENEDTTILDLFYDVQRYGDLKLNFFVSAPGFISNRLASIVAGKLTASPSALSNAAPFVELQVTNNGCLDIDDAELAVKIDLPAGVFEIDSANAIVKTGPDSSVRKVNTGPLAAGATFTKKFNLRVCQNALASASSLSFIAWVVATEDDGLSGQLLINNADDTLVQTVPIFREGDLTVTLSCDAPKLIADINAVSSESTLLSSSSSSSSESSVRDIELIKITRCTVQVSNDGFSDIGAKVNLDWVLPRETTLARWASTSKSQFVATSGGGVWAARAATTVIPVNCAGVPPAADKLELDFASLESGKIEVCARVAPTAGTVTVTGALGQCATVNV
jgi:hypothetical protein